MDTRLRVTDPSFELQRTEIPQTLMQPLAIIEPFNKRKDVSARLIPGVTGLMMHEFIFQRAEEALRHRIVITVALPAHARRHAEGGEPR